MAKSKFKVAIFLVEMSSMLNTNPMKQILPESVDLPDTFKSVENMQFL